MHIELLSGSSRSKVKETVLDPIQTTGKGLLIEGGQAKLVYQQARLLDNVTYYLCSLTFIISEFNEANNMDNIKGIKANIYKLVVVINIRFPFFFFFFFFLFPFSLHFYIYIYLMNYTLLNTGVPCKVFDSFLD